MGGNCHQKWLMIPLSPLFLGNLDHGVMSVLLKNERLECEIKVPLGYYSLSLSYVELKLEATISRVFSYRDVGVIFEMYILSSSQKLIDADPAGTLYLCSWGGVLNTKIHRIM